MAAVVNAVNTLINALGWFAMRAAARNDNSPIYKAQLRSRKVSVVASLIVQTTLTIAVLVKDPVVSIWLDGLGATFVAWIMVSIGLRMMWECTPDLLDHAVPDRVREQIQGLLATAGLEPEEPVRIRTRRSGSVTQVELTLAPVHCLSWRNSPNASVASNGWSSAMSPRLRSASSSMPAAARGRRGMKPKVVPRGSAVELTMLVAMLVVALGPARWPCSARPCAAP